MTGECVEVLDGGQVFSSGGEPRSKSDSTEWKTHKTLLKRGSDCSLEAAVLHMHVRRELVFGRGIALIDGCTSCSHAPSSRLLIEAEVNRAVPAQARAYFRLELSPDPESGSYPADEAEYSGAAVDVRAH